MSPKTPAPRPSRAKSGRRGPEGAQRLKGAKPAKVARQRAKRLTGGDEVSRYCGVRTARPSPRW